MELGANPKRGLVFTMASKDDGTRQPVPTTIRDIQKTSLVVQWLRICLPTQGTWVQFLAGELRSTGCRDLSPHATTREKPAHSNEGPTRSR